MLLFRTKSGPVVEAQGKYFPIEATWDDLINRSELAEWLVSVTTKAVREEAITTAATELLAPLVSQEVWAAGVTYYRSRTARMEEAEGAGGGNFYDRVYAAPRPELFLKATPHRVVGTGQSMKLRGDSNWIVPEPELVLVINNRGEIVGYTAGNDLSCRDIEGENPLYLPQAKTFDRCAAIGPCILVTTTPPAKETKVQLAIIRNGERVVDDSTTLAQLKRGFDELADWLFKYNSHPQGCLLMTGTGIIPAPDFSLRPGDVVQISIDGIGTLINTMD
jgi:2-dehydro-3-deoxy-D-arabinonate dehydratase